MDDPGSHVDPEEWSCEGQFYPWFWDAGWWVWVGAREEENAEEALPEEPPQKAAEQKGRVLKRGVVLCCCLSILQQHTLLRSPRGKDHLRRHFSI
jgi:hypothetical protein